MTYDIKILAGVATITKNWEFHREKFFAFACHHGGKRWEDEPFQEYMRQTYIDVDEPITTRLYELDDENLQALAEYILLRTEGMASRSIEFDD
jgi:hypothetical protein